MITQRFIHHGVGAGCKVGQQSGDGDAPGGCARHRHIETPEQRVIKVARFPR
jgi:hypothetical protein